VKKQRIYGEKQFLNGKLKEGVINRTLLACISRHIYPGKRKWNRCGVSMIRDLKIDTRMIKTACMWLTKTTMSVQSLSQNHSVHILSGKAHSIL
jgi:hypothetical protein